MSSPGCQDVRSSSCKQRLKRLSTHIAMSASCADHYKRVPRFRTSRRIAKRTESEMPSQYTTVPLQPHLHFNEPPWHVRRTRKAAQAQTHRQTQTGQTDANTTGRRNRNRQTQTEIRQDDNIRSSRTSKDTDETTTKQQRSQFAVVEDESTKQLIIKQ
jgi:hypothetical protein